MPDAVILPCVKVDTLHFGAVHLLRSDQDGNAADDRQDALACAQELPNGKDLSA